LQNNKVKYQFSLKSKDALNKLSHKALLKYVKDLHKNSKAPKTSNNSGICPSSEIVSPKKKNQSLRKKSDKDVGGQKGREGVTLRRREKADKIIALAYKLESCKKCKFDLNSTVSKLKERRQVLDIELSSIETKITEFQSYSKICPMCGYENHDNRGFSVSPNISYGATIIGMVSYLSVSQYMSNI